MVKIANPLYDYAFKYLMSNDKLAKKVLNTILEKEILELELSQTEHIVQDDAKHFTMYRLDFKALIRDATGKEERVLIEIQKSKLPSNLLRFRTYLGQSYLQKSAYINVQTGKEEAKAYPIISIYILGYNVEDIPVLAAKIDRKIIDASTKQELHIQSDFIELLTHTCYVLQARRLPPKRLSAIEKFMTIFNQAWVESPDKKFILDLQEIPEGFEDVVKFLQNSLSNSETIEKLLVEQEVEDIFSNHESIVAHAKQETEEAKAREEEERRQKEEERRQKEEERRQKEEERRQKEEERRQKEHILQVSIKAMNQTGMSDEAIARMFSVDIELVQRILAS